MEDVLDLKRVLEALSESALIEVTRELIRLNSVNPPGQEEAVCRVIAERAIAWGLEAEVQPIESGRANVIVRLSGTQAGPAILYCGHLDTVPAGERSWDHGPFSGDLVDGHIWGRGATDMKGGVAAMLVAMAALHKGGARFPGNLVFAGVAGEEVNCMGSRHFLMNRGMKNVGWLVVGEPTNLDLVIAHKGALHIEARTHGRAAHGSMPHLGTNAILHMAKFIKRLSGLTLEAPAHPSLSPPTMSINMIRGGERTNVVPDLCSVSIDIRTIPGQHHLDILAALRKEALALKDEVPDFREEFQVIHESAPVETSADHPFIFAAKRASRKVLGRDPRVRGVTYFTDASILQPPTGVPTLIFGPGDEGMAHQCNERLEVKSLATASRFFAALPFEVFVSGMVM